MLIVAVLPFVLAGIGGVFRVKQLGGLDNSHPRIQATKLEGIAARAYAAQQNAWEATAIFSVSVFIGQFAGVASGQADLPALVYVATRILHPILYVLDWATARSIVFVTGLVCCGRLLTLAATS